MTSAFATKEALFLRKLFISMGLDDAVSPLALFTDSMGCLFISKGEGTSSALKHVELCDFFTREQITRGYVSLSHVSAEFMVADALTKSLPSQISGRWLRRWWVPKRAGLQRFWGWDQTEWK